MAIQQACGQFAARIRHRYASAKDEKITKSVNLKTDAEKGTQTETFFQTVRESQADPAPEPDSPVKH